MFFSEHSVVLRCVIVSGQVTIWVNYQLCNQCGLF